MRTRSLFGYIFSRVLLIFVMLIVGLLYFSIYNMARAWDSEGVKALSNSTQVMINQYELLNDFVKKEHFCKKITRNTNIRITIINKDGSVLGDSHATSFSMENHRKRPEVEEALRGETGVSKRFSSTMGYDSLYIAYPILDLNGEAYEVFRTSIPLDAFNREIKKSLFYLLFMSIIILLIIIFMTSRIVNEFRLYIKRIEHVSASYASGNFSSSLPEISWMETINLNYSINKMGIQLQERINTINQQKDELQAMLNNMLEAVVLVNQSNKIEKTNSSARELFGTVTENSEDFFQSTLINEFIFNLMKSKEIHHEKEVIIKGEIPRNLLIHGTRIEYFAKREKHCLLVINDITKIRNMEKTRKDFVANVSHELKTPITSILGYISLLKPLCKKNKDAREYLKVISRHSERMTSIIDDLLILSNIEEGGEEKLRKELFPLIDLLESVNGSLKNKVKKKKITTKIDCSDNIIIDADPALLEQALLNLLSNGIKYCPEKSEITLKAFIKNENITIEVIDNGPGIAAEHQQRVFERFYRIDKSRSRLNSGTGLGLSIVKHIVNSHRGVIQLISSLDKGSCFRITLPYSDPFV